MMFDDSHYDINKVQYHEVLSTIRTQFTLLIRIITTLIIGDITIIGIAIKLKHAGILLVGAIFPYAFLYVIERFNKWLLPIIYVGVGLESTMGNEKDSITTALLGNITSYEMVENLKKIWQMKHQRERIELLKRSTFYFLSEKLRRRVQFILGLQVIIPFFLWLFGKWTML